MRSAILIIISSLFSILMCAQDTLTVQAFAYNSATRDSLIEFPQGDHNQYEKILMSYNMRCKGGLVSTTSDRNKGCGEWDYSCNTSIIDSSIVDSLLSFHPNFVIVGHNQPFLNYVTTPVYTYHLRDLDHVDVSTIDNEMSHQIGNNTATFESLSAAQSSQKIYYLIKSDELISNLSNAIGALSFDGVTQAKDLLFSKIRIAKTDATELDLESIDNMTFEIVVNDHIFSSELLNGKVNFKSDFSYNDGDNLILEITYTNPSINSDQDQSIFSNCSERDKGTFLWHHGNDDYVDFSNTTIDVLTDGIKSIQDQITVALWVKGNPNVLPKNTSIIYGVDADNNRQLNIHLPWSNGQIYWDCGGVGNNYDRLNMTADPTEFSGEWNHWAFTKNATAGIMTIYLNGKLWMSQADKTNPIDIQSLSIGSNLEGGNLYAGGIDDIMIFDKALQLEDIEKILYNRPEPDDDYYDNLKFNLDFNNIDDQQILDPLGNTLATFRSTGNVIRFRGEEIFKDFSSEGLAPDLKLYSGNYTRTVTTETITDSIQNFPLEVQPFRVEGSDLIQDPSYYVWQSGYTPIFDQNGMIVDSIEIETEDVIYIGELEYFTKKPSKFELLSFVTPYGINLDFGLNGKTWIFDVTDFGPILKGKKRLRMDRGGQWQEQMDIKFHFIKGIPTRNVKKIHQVWPIDGVSNANILNNNRFEKRTIPIEDDVSDVKLRVAITGHGQEGEFIPRNHFINLNGGANDYTWQVWKECAFNPVYPQGGTWVYDRAGWCPGAPTDLQEHEIMERIEDNNEFTIDYGMDIANGNSNYIVNTQIVKYGAPNFNLDASIEEIISPTNYVEYERLNPSCAKPRIVIKNNGATTLTSLWIAYGVVGTETISYQWKGSLDYLETTEVELPSFSEGRWSRGNEFKAIVKLPNQGQDEYENNNQMTSKFETTPHLNGNIIVRLITNGAPNETSWRLRDEDGNIIASRIGGLSAFTSYVDTITNLDGCYTLQFSDTDQDGISWWANSDGNGFINVREEGAAWTSLQRDFGAEITYAFTAGTITNVSDEDITNASIEVFPNPSDGVFNLELIGVEEARIQVIDRTGKLIKQLIHKGNATFDETYIDLSQEADGLYFLVVIDKNGNRITKKIIKG